MLILGNNKDNNNVISYIERSINLALHANCCRFPLRHGCLLLPLLVSPPCQTSIVMSTASSSPRNNPYVFSTEKIGRYIILLRFRGGFRSENLKITIFML